MRRRLPGHVQFPVTALWSSSFSVGTRTELIVLRLSTLVRLQWVFAIASLAYLVASAVHGKVTGEPLSAAPILPSILMFLAYIGCLYLPRMDRIGWYRIAMCVAILLFGGGGVIGNVLNYFYSGLENYASFSAWALAVAINSYGTILNLMAAFGWFQRTGTPPDNSDIEKGVS